MRPSSCRSVDRHWATTGMIYVLITVVDVRSYSLISGNTSKLIQHGSGRTARDDLFDEQFMSRVGE